MTERARARLVRGSTPNASENLAGEIAAHAVDLSTLLVRVGRHVDPGSDPAPAPSWLPTPDHEDETEWTSRLTLLRLTYGLVRVMKPQTMIEVGVERGFSTAVALNAMEENGVGELWSIDLPRLDVDVSIFTGQAIPAELRRRWHLDLGPSRILLPRLARRHAPLDLVLLDGDHSYDAQASELEAVWSHLAPLGVVVCDDIWTMSLSDFAHRAGVQPHYLARPAYGDAIGVVQRPG